MLNSGVGNLSISPEKVLVVAAAQPSRILQLLLLLLEAATASDAASDVKAIKPTDAVTVRTRLRKCFMRFPLDAIRKAK